ncbi:MAG: winged helix-turn-helix transcriptional regulator [Candidatus Aenigmarchaeota archaeon]|nr:winged helix-turn-helix transcriptional regulator [Candidatus Aenigmarchaeota archaeon]
MEIMDSVTLKALNTSTRQEIIKHIARRPYTASELSKILDKHVTTVAEHLGVLEKSGLVYRQEGNKWVYYKLTQKGESLLKPNYSWAVMFSMFFLIAAAGTYLYTSSQDVFMAMDAVTGAQESATAAQKVSPAEQSAPAEPPAPEPMNPDAILGLVLTFIGITGITYVAIRNLRAKTLTNQTI